MAFENRKYAIFASTELNKIDFNEVLETSVSTVRKSIFDPETETENDTKTFVKWDGDTIPSSVAGLSTYQGPYTHSEIKVILNTEEWVGTGST